MNSLTISEIDRQKAGRYVSCGQCLLATALRRRGVKNVQVGSCGLFYIGDKTFQAYLNGGKFDAVTTGSTGYKDNAPFYKKTVVGSKVTWKPAKN